MRRFIAPWAVCLAALVACDVATAASFLNLDFEDATIPEDAIWNDSDILPNEALPNWTTNVDSVHYAAFTFSIPEAPISPKVILWDRDEIMFNQVVEGNFSALLGLGTSIWQIGDIPNDAETLSLLELNYGSGIGRVNIQINDQLLPLVTTELGEDVFMHQVDISAFAGTTSELRITGLGLIDAIEFSTIPIPEPSAIFLFSVALCTLVSFGARCCRPSQGV